MEDFNFTRKALFHSTNFGEGIDLEEDYCLKNVQRTFNAIASEKSNLLSYANDYAVWDDTYAFAEDLNPDYVASNITPDTFSNLNVNFL